MGLLRGPGLWKGPRGVQFCRKKPTVLGFLAGFHFLPGLDITLSLVSASGLVRAVTDVPSPDLCGTVPPTISEMRSRAFPRLSCAPSQGVMAAEMVVWWWVFTSGSPPSPTSCWGITCVVTVSMVTLDIVFVGFPKSVERVFLNQKIQKNVFVVVYLFLHPATNGKSLDPNKKTQNMFC